MTALELERPERRHFLRLLGIGSGVLIAGSIVNRLNSAKNSKPVSSRDKMFQDFRVAESKKEVTFSDKNGEELLIIEKTA